MDAVVCQFCMLFEVPNSVTSPHSKGGFKLILRVWNFCGDDVVGKQVRSERCKVGELLPFCIQLLKCGTSSPLSGCGEPVVRMWVSLHAHHCHSPQHPCSEAPSETKQLKLLESAETTSLFQKIASFLQLQCLCPKLELNSSCTIFSSFFFLSFVSYFELE